MKVSLAKHSLRRELTLAEKIHLEEKVEDYASLESKNQINYSLNRFLEKTRKLIQNLPYPFT